MSCPAQFGGWSGQSADPWPAGKPLPRLLCHSEQPTQGPGAQLSGPGSFLIVTPLRHFLHRSQVWSAKAHSYSYIPPEWKSCLGAVITRSTSHE